MEQKKAREWLSELKKLREETEQVRQKLAAYTSLAEGTAAKNDSLGTRVDVSPGRRDDLICTVITVRERLERLCGQLGEKYFSLELILAEMPDMRLACLLKYIHIEGLSFAEAAEQLDLTERHVRRLHIKALDELEDLLEQKDTSAE